MTDIEVRAAGPDDAGYVRATLTAGWGGTGVVTRGELVDAAALPALVAWRAGDRAGLLTHRAHPDGARGRWCRSTRPSAVRASAARC